MRNFDLERTTKNRSIYKRAAVFCRLYCPICKPNKGCNQNWHKPIKSWKFKNKKRKQWM